jgi:hypothetical protein
MRFASLFEGTGYPLRMTASLTPNLTGICVREIIFLKRRRRVLPFFVANCPELNHFGDIVRFVARLSVKGVARSRRGRVNR